MALFAMLIMPLNAFPWVINGLMEAWVSVKRLQKFLLLEDLNWEKYYTKIQGLFTVSCDVIIEILLTLKIFSF